MNYQNMEQGIFLRRPNRFIAHVLLNGKEEICHVKNTGRCRELLVPGAPVWCEKSENPARKTRYSLICAEKNGKLVNLDSQAPNRVAREWVEGGGLGFIPKAVQSEVACGDSRLDLCFEQDGRPAYMEVKGVTLEQGGCAVFPDAPTQRGAKHLRRLTELAQEGLPAYVLFVVQLDWATELRPNWQTDPAFSQALVDAEAAGVRLLAICCHVTANGLTPLRPIPVCLHE